MKANNSKIPLRVSLLVVAVVFAMTLSAVLPYLGQQQVSSAISNTSGGTLRLALVGAPSSLNELTAPRTCESCWRIISLEYAFGLPILPNGSYDYQSGLFDSVVSNPNATVWNLNIRPGAKWSDGVAINSSDVVFTFGLGSHYIIYSSPTSPDFLSFYREVVAVEAVNSSDTQFTLNKTDAAFGYFLSSQYYYPIVPEHVVSQQNYTTDNNYAQDVTSGPFYHLAYDGGSSLILKPNPYYWNNVSLSQVVVNFVSNFASAGYLLKTNQSDLAQVDPATLASNSFSGNSSYGVNVEPDRALTYMEYNVTQYPYNMTGFRQGMAYAINTSEIVNSVYGGYATPGYLGRGLIPPSATRWYNASAPQYAYGPSLANQSMISAGLSYANGKLLYPNRTQVSLHIFTDSNYSADNATAQIVASNLRASGINASVTVMALGPLIAEYVTAVDGVDRGIVVASINDTFFGIGHLDIQPAYNTYYPWSVPWSVPELTWLYPPSANSEYLSLLSLADTSTDPAQVQAAVKNINGLNAEYLPLIVLAYPDALWVYRNNGPLTGFSTVGEFDLGQYSLYPYAFTLISCTSSACPSYNGTTVTLPTSTSSSTTTSSSSNTTTTSTTGPPPPNPDNNLLLVAAIGVIIALIAIGTVLSRRKRPQPP